MSHLRISRILSTNVAKRKRRDEDGQYDTWENLAEDVYIIPNGKVLVIDRFFGGHEESKREVRVELLKRDASDELIAVGYGSGCTFQLDVDREFTGNGSKAIVIRLINGDRGSDLHMTGSWSGYERGQDE